jgi:hypothetical protein
MMTDLDIDCIYVNGDSWAYGSELRDPARPDIKNDFDVVHDTYRQAHNWPGLLGKEYNLPVINSGWAGGSNHRILRTTITDITNLKREGRKPLAIIAWTQMQRFELYNAENDHWIEFVGPSAAGNRKIGLEMWEKYSNDRSDLTQYLQHLILMDAFLKTNSVPYVGTNIFRHNFNILEDLAVDPQFAPYLHQLSKVVGIERHLYNASVSQILIPHLDIKYGPGGHPLEAGQLVIAEHFKNKINQQYNFTSTGITGTA